MRSAPVPQRFIIPAAPVQAHETDFEQSYRTITEMLKQFGIDASVMMAAGARAFVGPIVVGKSGQWIDGWINPPGQLMGQAADNISMLSSRFHDQSPARPAATGHQSK